MFLFAFIFLSLIAHVCFSVIENECSALRFLLFKQGTPRPVTRQVPSGSVLPSTVSAKGMPSLFDGFISTITLSDFSSTYMFIVRFMPS